jgi:hypothetical protein
MELEKIATELAQKAVAVRHSDNRLKPGEYPEWAAEFRKLAQEHYADLAMIKQAEGEAPAAPAPEAPPPPAATGSYNPYNMYDNAVTPGGFMANPIVRNALVTGGLGAGVGALGSLASNLFSRKRKKRYLSDALSAGLLGGLAGGVGGAGYTALTDDKANVDFTNKAMAALGMNVTPPPPPAQPSVKGHMDEVLREGYKLTPGSKNLQSGMFYGGAAGLASKPIIGLGRDLAGGRLTSSADTAKMLSNMNARINDFRQNITDPGSRKLFDRWLDSNKLLNSGNSVEIAHPRQLSKALQGLSELESGKVGGKLYLPIDPNTGQPMVGRVDTNSFLNKLLGTGGAAKAPGVIQSFSNQDLATRRLEGIAKGRNLTGGDVSKFLDKAYNPQATNARTPAGSQPSPTSRTFYDRRALLRMPGKYSGGLGALGIAASYGLPLTQNNTDARGAAMADYLATLRENVSNSAASQAEKAKQLQAISEIQNRYMGPLEAAQVGQAFGDIGRANIFPGAGK